MNAMPLANMARRAPRRCHQVSRSLPAELARDAGGDGAIQVI